MADSVDPDQTPHSMASKPGLFFLLMLVCPITVNTVLMFFSIKTLCCCFSLEIPDTESLVMSIHN